MQSHSYQSYASPGVKTLIAEEVKKLLTSPLVKSCALVLITMLLMVTIALSLGIWWDGLWSEGYNFPRGTQKPLVPGIVVVAPMLPLLWKEISYPVRIRFESRTKLTAPCI